MTSCAFVGHREVYASGIDYKLRKAIESLVLTDTEFVFYVGGMGTFDQKCAAIVRSLKQTP